MSRLVHDLQSFRPAAAAAAAAVPSSSSLMSVQVHDTLRTINDQLNQLQPLSPPDRYITLSTGIIPGPAVFHGTWNSLFAGFAAEFAAFCKKVRNCPFLLHLYLIRGFWAPF